MKTLVTYSKLLKMYKSREAGIESLKSIKHLLPLYPSKRLAGIVGDMFGDGHLQGPKLWRLDFTSASLKELKRFEKEFYLEFGVKGKVRKCTTNIFGSTYNYGINNKRIARLLFLCGVPYGNKVFQQLEIPNWILSNKLYFKRFVQRLFDCEGTVDVDNKYVEICMSKNDDIINNGYEFFDQIRYRLLKYYGIVTTNVFTVSTPNRRKDDLITRQMKFKIKRQDSVLKFSRSIGFETRRKQQKLIVIARSIENSRKGW